jgi:hypothetical protein
VLLYTDGAWDTLADDDGCAEARLQAAIALRLKVARRCSTRFLPTSIGNCRASRNRTTSRS